MIRYSNIYSNIFQYIFQIYSRYDIFHCAKPIMLLSDRWQRVLPWLTLPQKLVEKLRLKGNISHTEAHHNGHCLANVSIFCGFFRAVFLIWNHLEIYQNHLEIYQNHLEIYQNHLEIYQNIIKYIQTSQILKCAFQLMRRRRFSNLFPWAVDSGLVRNVCNVYFGPQAILTNLF